MLDIFFEVLNYETIEQKKAYEIAGLLGELMMAPVPFHIMGMVWLPTTQIRVLTLSHSQEPFPKLHCVACKVEKNRPPVGMREEWGWRWRLFHMLLNLAQILKVLGYFVNNSFFLNNTFSFWESGKMQKSIEKKIQILSESGSAILTKVANPSVNVPGLPQSH